MLQVVLAAPRELRKAEFEREIIARRGLEYQHAGAHDLRSYAITPYDPDLDHCLMLATGKGRHQARKGYNSVGAGNVGRGVPQSSGCRALLLRSCTDKRVS